MKSGGHRPMPSQTANLWHNFRRCLFLCVIAAGLLPIHSYAQSWEKQSTDVVGASIPIDAYPAGNDQADRDGIDTYQRHNLITEAEAKQLAAQTHNSAAASINSLGNIFVQPRPNASCGGLAQEAEDATLNGTFIVGEDTAASGGKYIHTPNGSGNFYNGPATENRAEFCFTVSITGTYYIRASTFAADTLNDSFYVQVDGAPELGYLWDIFPTSSYIIDYVNDRFFFDPVELELSPGEHIVTFYPREDGARLDTVELQFTTPNSGPIPTCGGLIQEAEEGALRGSFAVEEDPTASGGKYIDSPENTGSYWYGPNTLQSAKYCFDVKNAGIYRIDARVFGPDLLSDSFYVRVDDPKSIAYLWDTHATSGFVSDSVNHRFVADPVLLKLPSGLHTVTVYVREDGTKLDTLQLVFTDTYTEPEEPPVTALPISGTIHPDSSDLTEEVDFSTIYVKLIDAATRGQVYSQRVQVDRIGRYRFEGMAPGKYILVLELPATYTTAQTEVEVDASTNQSVSVSFDIQLKLEHVYLPLIGR